MREPAVRRGDWLQRRPHGPMQPMVLRHAVQVHRQEALVRAGVLRPLEGARVFALLQKVRSRHGVVQRGVRFQEGR